MRCRPRAMPAFMRRSALFLLAVCCCLPLSHPLAAKENSMNGPTDASMNSPIAGISDCEFTFADGRWKAEGARAALWGGTVDCSISMEPPGNTDAATVRLFRHPANSLSEKYRARLRKFADMLPGLRQNTLPRRDDLNAAVNASFDYEGFRANNRELQVLLKTDNSPSGHCLAARPLMEKSIAVLKTINLPEELRRDDSGLYMGLGILNMQAHGLKDKLEKEKTPPAQDCVRTLDGYIAALESLIDVLDEHSARARGLPRAMTPEETAATMTLEEELAGVEPEDEASSERKIALAEQLLALPLLAPEDKISIIEDVIESFTADAEEDEEDEAEDKAAKDGKKTAAAFPPEFTPYFAATAEALSRLNTLGAAHFVDQLAEKALAGAEKDPDGREPGVSREALAAHYIKPRSIEFTVTDGPSVQTVITFKAEPFFNKKPPHVVIDKDGKESWEVPAYVFPAAIAKDLSGSSLGADYLEQLKRAARSKGGHQDEGFRRSHGASVENLLRLKAVYPDVPPSLVGILAGLDGTYYRDYGGKEVTLYVFGGVLPYYLNSVEQMLKGTGKDGDSIADIYGEENLGELVGPGIDPHQPMTRMLHVSDCMNNGGSSQLYIDFHPAKGGVKGQIVRFVHDEDEYRVIAPSFDAFLRDNLNSNFSFLDDEE